jgi:hypothetical protein
MDGDQREALKEEKLDARGPQAIVCARCRHALTHKGERLERAGRHAHTFMNPSGVVFHVRLFKTVDGAEVFGAPESETTWFPGTVWRYARCASCRFQVGWSYTGDDDGRFFALIEDAIDGES